MELGKPEVVTAQKRADLDARWFAYDKELSQVRARQGLSLAARAAMDTLPVGTALELADEAQVIHRAADEGLISLKEAQRLLRDLEISPSE